MEERVARRMRRADDLRVVVDQLRRAGVLRTPPVEEVAARAAALPRRRWSRRRKETGVSTPN